MSLHTLLFSFAGYGTLYKWYLPATRDIVFVLSILVYVTHFLKISSLKLSTCFSTFNVFLLFACLSIRILVFSYGVKYLCFLPLLLSVNIHILNNNNNNSGNNNSLYSQTDLTMSQALV